MSENVNKHVKLHVLKTTGKTQDIALIQIGNKNLLIDSGSSDLSTDHLEEIKKILKYEEIPEGAPVPDQKKIHYIYITHYHGDHIGGLSTFGANDNGIDMDGAVIFLPQMPYTTYEARFVDHENFENALNTKMNYHAIISLASSHNMTKIFPGDTVSDNAVVSDDYTNIIDEETGTRKYKTVFEIGANSELHLDFKNYDIEKYYTTDSNSTYYNINDTPENAHNNTSLCCVMTYGKTRIGFFGDIGLKAQENLAGEIGHLDLMNVPHHGVDSGHYRPFFDKIAPKMCFTQDGCGLHYNKTTEEYDWHILSERSKTHAYLQENGIPNYAVSVNETMTFDIYKSGISTKENAVKYAVNFKGASSIFNAINDNVKATAGDVSLLGLLKNMEHGTFLSCTLKKNALQLWKNLFETLEIGDAEYSELIVYKSGSIYRNSQLSKYNSRDSGYIIMIPHTNDSLLGPLTAYWYTEDNYATATLKSKPTRDVEFFKYVKKQNKTQIINYNNNLNFLTLTDNILVPKENCMMNYTIYFENTTNADISVDFNDGDDTQQITIPKNSCLTIPNFVVLKKSESLTIPTHTGLYVKLCGTLTHSQAQTKSLVSGGVDSKLPSHSGYPQF